MGHRSNQQGCDYGTFTYAFDTSHIEEGNGAGDQYQRHIEVDFDKTELAFHESGDDLHEVLSGHHRYIGFHLKADSHTKQHASHQPPQDMHGDIDKGTEAEGNRHLQQQFVTFFTNFVPLHHAHFEQDKEEIHDNGVTAQCTPGRHTEA